MLFISSILFAYLFAELTFFLFQSPDHAAGFNKPATIFDPIRGYRWSEDSIRTFRFRKGKFSYDNVFTINEQGWVMDQDYSFKKKDTSTFRWILFGDSFMAGVMLQENLPNKVQNYFNDKNYNTEFYSFAVDGGGISNWYNIFFKEVLPNYEFDAVILAPYEDNLYRDFTISLIQENGYLGRIDSVDWKAGDTFNPSDYKELKPYNNIYTDKEIDELSTNPGKTFNFHIKELIYIEFKKKFLTKKQQHQTRVINNFDQLSKKMGHNKSAQLNQIISYCQKNDIPILLASVPSLTELKNELERKPNRHQIEMNIVKEQFQIPYFDGYKVFQGLNEQEIESNWLWYDGHWNQKGSDRYADKFAEYLEGFQLKRK